MLFYAPRAETNCKFSFESHTTPAGGIILAVVYNAYAFCVVRDKSYQIYTLSFINIGQQSYFIL